VFQFWDKSPTRLPKGFRYFHLSDGQPQLWLELALGDRRHCPRAWLRGVHAALPRLATFWHPGIAGRILKMDDWWKVA